MTPVRSIAWRLWLIAAAALCVLALARYALVEDLPRPDAGAMRRAEARAAAWFGLVDSLKKEAGPIPDDMGTPFAGLLGAEWSEITTTLGSQEAKRTAANPAFAALLVRLLHDAGIDSSVKVGIMLSGSFPSLGIAALAAVQTIGAEAVIISSLGSSSYGANQPGATWLDIEEYLAGRGKLRYRSALVTMGAEGDSGGGLSDEGIRMLRETAGRYGITLYHPQSFAEAVSARMALLRDAALVINIGGNQASLGVCPHAPVLPHGLITRPISCDHTGRGVIERLLERGVPVLHLLNINAFAVEHGLPLTPGSDPAGWEGSVYVSRSVSRLPVAALLAGLVVLAFLLRRRQM